MSFKLTPTQAENIESIRLLLGQCAESLAEAECAETFEDYSRAFTAAESAAAAAGSLTLRTWITLPNEKPR